jgi:hypothetical protein
MRFCTTCGSPVSGMLRFCTRCGAGISSTAGPGVAGVAAAGTGDAGVVEAGTGEAGTGEAATVAQDSAGPADTTTGTGIPGQGILFAEAAAAPVTPAHPASLPVISAQVGVADAESGGRPHDPAIPGEVVAPLWDQAEPDQLQPDQPEADEAGPDQPESHRLKVDQGPGRRPAGRRAPGPLLRGGQPPPVPGVRQPLRPATPAHPAGVCLGLPDQP